MDRKLKGLVVAPQPFFSPRGTPYSVYYRTRVTAELGAELDLLTYGQGQDVDIPGVRIIRIPRFGFLGPVRIGPSPLKLFLDVFMAAWTVGLLARRRYDFVHAHEEAVFFCRALQPLFGFKLLYDMHSSLPQQLTNFDFTRSRLLIGVFRRLEDACLRAADAVITICPDLYDYVNQRLPGNRKNFLIENSIFEPVQLSGGPDAAPAPCGSGPLPEAGLAGRRLVVYAGTLEPYQGIDILLEAFARLPEGCSDLALLVVGGRPAQVAHYRKMADRLGLGGRVHFTGSVPQPVANRCNRMASVLVSPRSSGTNTPLKIYEQLASGIPLVATRIHSHTQVLTDEVAVLVAPEPEDMARGIRLAADPDGPGRRLAAAARRLYEQKYSRPVYEAKMKSVLEELTACAA